MVKIFSSLKCRPSFFLSVIFIFIFIVLAVSPVRSMAASGETQHYHFSSFKEGEWGLGLFLGDPLGVQTRYFTNWKHAFSFTSGYSSAKTVVLALDYLFYGYSAQDKVRNRDFWNSLIFYGGFGALTGIGAGGNDPTDSFQLGLRAVGGIEYIFVGSPWSLRIESAPELFLKAKNTLGFEVGLGLTYYWGEGKKVRSSFKQRDPSPKYEAPSHEELDEFDDSNEFN
jgi:hypothetical protein